MVRENIVLIGMPASGKSTVGRALSEKCSLDFIDTDDVIVQRTGSALCDIIQDKGIQKFLDIERDAVLTVACICTIISTGGSVIYRDEAMRHLKAAGQVYYLKQPFYVIERRLKSIQQRGVTMKKGQTLKDLYDERTHLYEKYCDTSIDCKGMSVDEIVQGIVGKAGIVLKG